MGRSVVGSFLLFFPFGIVASTLFIANYGLRVPRVEFSVFDRATMATARAEASQV